jgi:hypothetical protein
MPRSDESMGIMGGADEPTAIAAGVLWSVLA